MEVSGEEEWALNNSFYRQYLLHVFIAASGLFMRFVDNKE